MKILSVDDSKMVHMVIAKALRGHAITHLTALSGEEGVATATAEHPDLILLDITMPTMTGLEALALLKANPATAAIPVVMLTAEGGADTRDRAMELGVSDYLTKPFTEEILLTALSGIVQLPGKG